MHLYISGTYKMLYYLKGGQLYQIPYYLPEFKQLISSPADTETDGVLAPIKGRTAEPSHNRIVKKHLEELAKKKGGR